MSFSSNLDLVTQDKTTYLVVINLRQELFSFCITTQKEVCFYSWMRGQLTMLTNLAKVTGCY